MKPREIAKRIPVLPSLYRMLRSRYIDHQLKRRTTEQVFTDIYRGNKFAGEASVSGPGSDVYQTRIIIEELPSVFNEFGVSTVLDIPCGDFYWMNNVDFGGIDYTGADIVSELIEKNKEQYGRDGVRFQKLNLITDNLPKVDLIFCRDCLVHFPYEDIFRALRNVCDSQSKYILTTTFTGRIDNHNIEIGQWRTINLELAPFHLPKPLKLIIEGCTESDGAYADKSLGLWRIADIRESLSLSCLDELD